MTRRGRPKGTGCGHLDAPLHEQMREMLEQGIANSRTAAAKRSRTGPSAPRAVGADGAFNIALTVRKKLTDGVAMELWPKMPASTHADRS